MVVGVGLVCLYLLLKAAVGALADLDTPTLAGLTVGALCLLPVAVAGAYHAGKSVAYNNGYEQGHLNGQRAGLSGSRRRIEQLEEEAQDRGNIYLKGAERGLGIADKLVKTREVTRRTTEQKVVVLPSLPAVEFAQITDGEVIDV